MTAVERQQLIREVRSYLEHRRGELLVQHQIWYCLPWYRKLFRTLTLRRPEPL